MQNYTFDYSQYKKKITHKKTKGIIPLIFLICILVVCAMFVMPKTANLTEFFLLEVDSFSTYKEASSLALELQNQGGAGYVYFDGKYRVFASLYTSEKDAEKVSDNLSEYYSSNAIYNLSTNKKINTKNLTEAQKNAVENYANFCLKSVDEIASLIVSFDKSEIDEVSLKNRLSTYCSQSKKYYEELISVLPKNSKFNISKEYAYDINSSFEDLKNFSSSSNLKYNLIKLVISYCSFVDSF